MFLHQSPLQTMENNRTRHAHLVVEPPNENFPGETNFGPLASLNYVTPTHSKPDPASSRQFFAGPPALQVTALGVPFRVFRNMARAARPRIRVRSGVRFLRTFPRLARNGDGKPGGPLQVRLPDGLLEPKRRRAPVRWDAPRACPVIAGVSCSFFQRE